VLPAAVHDWNHLLAAGIHEATRIASDDHRPAFPERQYVVVLQWDNYLALPVDVSELAIFADPGQPFGESADLIVLEGYIRYP
jgi:hypothetical protein